MIVGSNKVYNAISRPLPLFARRRDDTMSAAAQHAIGELHSRISKIDDGASLLWFHPEPFAWTVGFQGADFSRAFGPYLEAAEPVHQDSNTAGYELIAHAS